MPDVTMEPNRVAPAVELHLLDSALGHPVQTWRFVERPSLTVGRAEDCDVTTADGRVSRRHAEIDFGGGGWTIKSLGKNGVFINGDLVVEAVLSHSTVFQLGSGGPSFKFCEIAEDRHPGGGTETIDNVDPSIWSFLELDERKKDEEIRKIVEGSSFQDIQERSRKLKQGTFEEEQEEEQEEN